MRMINHHKFIIEFLIHRNERLLLLQCFFSPILCVCWQWKPSLSTSISNIELFLELLVRSENGSNPWRFGGSLELGFLSSGSESFGQFWYVLTVFIVRQVLQPLALDVIAHGRSRHVEDPWVLRFTFELKLCIHTRFVGHELRPRIFSLSVQTHEPLLWNLSMKCGRAVGN